MINSRNICNLKLNGILVGYLEKVTKANDHNGDRYPFVSYSKSSQKCPNPKELCLSWISV